MEFVAETFSVVFKNIMTHLYDEDSLIQLFISFLFFGVSFLVSLPIKKTLHKDHFLDAAKSEKKKTVYGLIFPLIWFIMQWVTIFIYSEYDKSVLILRPIASLLTAWIVIHIMASFVQQTMMFRVVSISAWIVAALDITGFLDPIRHGLEKVRLHVGHLELSLLAFVQGLLAIIFLLWLAVSLSRYLENKIQKDPRLEPSAKVLFSKVVKIALYVMAFFWGISIMGIDISALAFMGGAIGVGIGFGLQKVVSNFICGIILLLDKSIKPGDVVALSNGETYGYVNRLNARYVSVRTRSGKEHLIPNEDFVTKKVENWSYSDKAVRLKIKVGVGYDSDIHLVKKVLAEATLNVDRVLADPEPGIRLIDFGDSSIIFELRVWISDPEKGIMNVRSNLLTKIWDLFKENGITLPFPQRDLHIRSNYLEGFPVRLSKE